MKNFKEYLTEGYRLFKTNKNEKLWYLNKKDYVDAKELPIANLAPYNEAGGVRMAVDTKGDVWVWDGRVLHQIFWEFAFDKTPFINLQYDNDDKYIYASFYKQNNVINSKLFKYIKNNLNIIKTAFPKILKLFPNVEGIIVGADFTHILSLKKPYTIKKVDWEKVNAENYNI